MIVLSLITMYLYTGLVTTFIVTLLQHLRGRETVSLLPTLACILLWPHVLIGVIENL